MSKRDSGDLITQEFVCTYCTQEGKIDGIFEILGKNHIALFTPEEPDAAQKFQCVISIHEVLGCAVIGGPSGSSSSLDSSLAQSDEDDEEVANYLQIQMKFRHSQWSEEIRNLFYRFADKQLLRKCCGIILKIMASPPPTSSPASESITNIPFFSDHLNLSLVPTTMYPVASNTADTESAQARHEHLLSPPPITVLRGDQAAAEFAGGFLLTSDRAAEIREMLPLEFRFCEMRLLFSPKIHGISIPSFYRHVEDCPFPSVVIMRDAAVNCCVLGAFCKAPWVKDFSRKFFGSSENFVFKLVNKGKPDMHVFPCISTNSRLYQFCDEKRIVIGQGAICVYDNWLRGSSNPCETYGTITSLCCRSEFVVGDIEFWSLIPEGSSCASVLPVVNR